MRKTRNACHYVLSKIECKMDEEKYLQSRIDSCLKLEALIPKNCSIGARKRWRKKDQKGSSLFPEQEGGKVVGEGEGSSLNGCNAFFPCLRGLAERKKERVHERRALKRKGEGPEKRA